MPNQGPLPLSEKKYLIFDCDAGADDAHALIYTFYLKMMKERNSSEDIKVLGITSTYGNTSMANSTVNMAITLELIKE